MRYGLYAAAVLAISLAAVACGDADEQLPAASPTVTVSPASSATSPPTATPTANATRDSATPAGVSADWKTYSDPGGLFTLRYPPNWFQSPGQAQFSSKDLSTLTTTERPSEAVVVEVVHYTAAGSTACGGALSVDPKSGEGFPQTGASPTTLGGLTAWESVRLPGDPAIEGGLTRIQVISVIYKGYCFIVAAYFTQQTPDIATFLEVADTFHFQFWGTDESRGSQRRACPGE